MSYSITLTSSAYVGPSTLPNPVIFQYTNPEIVLSNLISDYLAKVGFSQITPFFEGVRVGAEHPFVNFLYNDENGNELDFNLLPSVTVTDSNEDETLDTLGIGYEPETIDSTYVATVQASLFDPSTNRGFLVTSSQNIARLQAATANGAILSGVKRWMTQQHSIELSIWADNKNVTAVLFDAINTFILSYIDQMHLLGIDFIGISGKRSGDFNIDFGRLLYGASVVFNAFIRVATVEVNLETATLQDILINPNYNAG